MSLCYSGCALVQLSSPVGAGALEEAVTGAVAVEVKSLCSAPAAVLAGAATLLQDEWVTCEDHVQIRSLGGIQSCLRSVWRMLLLYTALRLHQGVNVGGTIVGLLGWGFWLHLCHALASVGTHKHLANARRMARRSAQRSSRRGHAACWYDPCTRHACLYECFVRMLAHHRELQHSRLHRWSPQFHASLLEVRTSAELRMLVAEYLADQGASPSLVAGTRGCAPGGTAAVWALTNMSGLPVRIVTGMGSELLRTAPMQVWSLRLHHQHYTILEPLERSSLHTRAVKVALLEQPLQSVHARRGLCSRVLTFVQLLAGKAQALACTAPSTSNIADRFFAFSLFEVLNSIYRLCWHVITTCTSGMFLQYLHVSMASGLLVQDLEGECCLEPTTTTTLCSLPLAPWMLTWIFCFTISSACTLQTLKWICSWQTATAQGRSQQCLVTEEIGGAAPVDPLASPCTLQTLTLKWFQLWQKATAQVRACCDSVSAVLGGASLLDSDPLRGAGKQAKGHLPWETTSTTMGLKLLTSVTVKVDQTRRVLPTVAADSLCVQSCGCALVLLATLLKNKDMETTEPMVLLFPGSVVHVLAKHGVAASRYREDEVALEMPHSAEVVRRRVTLLTLQAGLEAKNVLLDAEVKHISIQPRMAYELLIELDLRWADSASRAAAQEDWKMHCASLLSSAVQQPIGADRLYFLRRPMLGSMMSVYGARVRMGRDLAEKALCASGRQSLFIRPIDVGGFPEAGSFSLVWATMPETPVEQLLAT
eukprot:6491533-Amphidinium_carterae.1